MFRGQDLENYAAQFLWFMSHPQGIGKPLLSLAVQLQCSLKVFTGCGGCGWMWLVGSSVDGRTCEYVTCPHVVRFSEPSLLPSVGQLGVI